SWAVSTRAGDQPRSDWTNIRWTFEGFMDYVRSVPNGRAVICVNVATGSPEEAAEWVRYANKVKGYHIRDWQIGNENDGDWEEAGPLSARQYAAKFLSFSRAMKAVDPSIHIHGPLHSSDEFNIKGDGLYSGHSWMETFLQVVGEAEKRDHKTWLDAVDFHTYPYWTSTRVEALGMLRGSARPGPWMDTLAKWMATYLPDGGKREVHMSEFSSTVVASSQTLRAVQASSVLHLFAQFLVRFGDRGHVLPWDTYGSLQKGPDGTYGSLRMANLTPAGSKSSWGNYTPSTQYYGLRLASQDWVREGLHMLPVQASDSAVRAFALGNGDTTRILLINLSGRELPVQVSRNDGLRVAGQVFLFSDANYLWQGDGQDAFANPGMGPWSNRFSSSASVDVQLPAMGIALVSWDPTPPEANPVIGTHYALRSSTLLPGDTLTFWGSFRQDQGSLLKGSYRCPPFVNNMELQFADGVPGGSQEGVFLQISIPRNAKPGPYRLGLELEGEGGEGLAEVLKFRVRGSYRTVLALADFNGSVADVDEDFYTYAHGENSTSITPTLQSGLPPQGGFLKATFHIEQPLGQGWPNFAALHFPVRLDQMAGQNIPGVPKGTVIAGVVFDYACQHSNPDGFFEFYAPSTVVTDYDEFRIPLRNTHGNWVRDTVLWSQMNQEGWGKSMGALDATIIKELEFRIRGEGDGELRLDNLFLLAEDGKEIPLPEGLRRIR
ncbi:MAG TPA: glycoside hydrolase family 44 protein, partial [Fibrobacteraceae bacterium]|nr:glycoside hydrolase family 44 protein [Fibrobacteraceae bacterium]